MYKVPKDATLYIGPTGYQQGFYVGNPDLLQINIPDLRNLPDTQLLGSWSIAK